MNNDPQTVMETLKLIQLLSKLLYGFGAFIAGITIFLVRLGLNYRTLRRDHVKLETAHADTTKTVNEQSTKLALLENNLSAFNVFKTEIRDDFKEFKKEIKEAVKDAINETRRQ